MSIEQRKTILIVGASGYFGSLLTRDLAIRVLAKFILAGRNQTKLNRLATALRSKFNGDWSCRRVDVADGPSIDRALDGVDIVVCAAGPFQSMRTTLAGACMDRYIHYIDLADDRRFISLVRALAIERQMPLRSVVCTGWSTLPALTSVLARMAVGEVKRIESIEIEMAPGNRAPRAKATVSALLSSVSCRFTVPRDGQCVEVDGWSEPRSMSFPHPIGTRTGYLLNAPEYDLFPHLFKAPNVSFRVGAEFSFNHWLVSGLAWMSRRGLVHDWTRFAGPLRTGMAMFGFLGTEAGAVGVRVTGITVDERPVVNQASIVAATNGQSVPIVPAVCMVEMLTSGSWTHSGLTPYDSWITRRDLESECTRRGFQLVVKRGNTEGTAS